MKQHDFTDIQTRRILELVSRLYDTNTILSSDSKIDGIAFYKDKNLNFMCSYNEYNYDQGNFKSTIYYVMIDTDGKVIDAIEYYGSDVLADEKCMTMTKITLS